MMPVMFLALGHWNNILQLTTLTFVLNIATTTPTVAALSTVQVERSVILIQNANLPKGSLGIGLSA